MGIARAHNISLPRTKRRLNIDEASAALSQMGYRLGNVRYDAATSASIYKITQPNGAVIEVPATKIADFVYGKIKDLNMNSGTKAAFSATVTGAAAYTKNLIKSLGFDPDSIKVDTARSLLVIEFRSAPIIAGNCASKLSYALANAGKGAASVSMSNGMERRNGEDVGVVTVDLGDVAARGLGFSRTGAKAAFAANNVDLWNFLSKSDFIIARQNANDLANLKKYASMALTVPDFTPPSHQQHGPSLHAMAKDTLADIKKWEQSVSSHKNRAPWSRSGVKAAFALIPTLKAKRDKWQKKFETAVDQDKDADEIDFLESMRQSYDQAINALRTQPVDSAMSGLKVSIRSEAYQEILSTLQSHKSYSRTGAKAAFDLRAKVQQMKATVKLLVSKLGFKPDEVTGNDQMMHILFENQPKQADRLAAALRTNLARVGVPASAITTHEHHYEDDNTTYGGVWIDLNALANASAKKMSRTGAKAAFSESSAWIAKYLPALNQWWRDRTDHPTDLDASSDRWEIEGVLDDVAEHCREAVPREAKPSWYAAALRDVKKIQHSRKASMKSHFAVKKSVSGTLVTLVPKAKGAGWKSYYAEWQSAKDARVTHHGVLVERDDGRVTLTHTSGQVVSEGTAGFGSMSAIRMSRTGVKSTHAIRSDDPFALLLQIEYELRTNPVGIKEWSIPSRLRTVEKLAKIDNVPASSDFWKRLQVAKQNARNFGIEENSRTGAKSTHAADDSVSRKIATLVREGYDQKQAAAIAYDMKRRGEI